jgi:hypothetical protein
MRVKATKPGFYKRLHKPGDKPFDLDDPKDFSGAWMERVGPKPKDKGKSDTAGEKTPEAGK